ncbi:MAG: alpha/beta hydrolase [Alphaproteobacteria bacterium]|nr:MAG: alpha/beta hydrolase [Alphaproteobacteria bacterium]
MEEIQFATEDGHDLPASLFESNSGRIGEGPVVLISSATATPRRFYRHFAQYLADNGARAVMTYDYRGMTGRPKGKRRLRMADWAVKDLPAAARELRRRYPDTPLAGLGHSFGGQALGLSGVADRFSRYMTLAAGSGYLGYTREATKLWFTMNVIGYPLAALLGHLPAWAGMGESIPFGAFNQWRRWCNSPDYFMSDPTVPETARFAEVRIAMVAVGFHDDPWATLESTRALMEWYSHADIKLKWFTEQDAHGPVGHFGFFRPEHKETLWPQIADWLTQY